MLPWIPQASGLPDEASVAASDALDLIAKATAPRSAELSDPLSARLAIEVLFRAGRVDEALARVKGLPLSSQMRLTIGATLGAIGQTEEAHKYLDAVNSPGSGAVHGFLAVLENNNQLAITHLREALKYAPGDADSAHNLSIALWKLGATKKAIAASLRATRSAPGREDVALRYLNLLLAEGSFDRLDEELERILKTGVAATSRLTVIRARAQLVRGEIKPGIRLLERAAQMARTEGDDRTFSEVQSNIVRLRASRGEIARERAIEDLLQLHRDFPGSDVVVANLAQVADRKRHAAALIGAFTAVRAGMDRSREAFIEYQIATLSGQNAAAANWARDWLALNPRSTHARTAAMVALGIGEERWEEAREIANGVDTTSPTDLTLVNNAAYIFAMCGMGERAVDMLSPHVHNSYVLKATLGLAHLSMKDIPSGMRLYREAAEQAEKLGNDSRSLMTCYQALVVRQLGLLQAEDANVVTALSLPPVALPDDWAERPEFLRLRAVASKHGYGWPLSL